MSAMPRAQQVERVLENVVPPPKAASSPNLDMPAPWRLVSRDGSTSSLKSSPSSAKDDCPDCAAGRCGQNLPGCHCAQGGRVATISLERVPEPHKAPSVPVSGPDVGPAPTMPQANPQLFEQAARPAPRTALPQSPRRQRESLLPHPSLPSADKSRLLRAHSPADGAGIDPSTASPSASKTLPDDLQKVIDRWPTLSRSTRRAILLLANNSSEADSA
ncbi:MAG: hypothetical protein ACYC6Y_11545 [Thermoguttaceae bacterium]